MTRPEVWLMLLEEGLLCERLWQKLLDDVMGVDELKEGLTD
jgi:hypothetical protein